MFRTIQGFFFLWAVVQTFLGFMIRMIYPTPPKDGGRIAFWLMLQAITGFLLLVAFILTRQGILELLSRVLIKGWGF